MRFIYCVVLISTLFLSMMFSCNRVTSNETVEEDTLNSEVDSVLLSEKVDSIEENVVIPKSADEYFNDFLYSFTTNSSFQKSRVKFPLELEIYGVSKTMQPEEWSFTRLHTLEPVYLVFLDKESSLQLEKSRKVDNVVIELFQMKNHEVKRYCFTRSTEKWQLTKLQVSHLSDNSDFDFISFYQRFATDSTYQYQHLCEEIEFTATDYDEDEGTITGTIEPRQLTVFCPELPSGSFTHIDYGQKRERQGVRVVAIEGTSNGFVALLFFKKVDGEWKLFCIKN